MGQGLRTDNPTVVSAFHAALLHQFLFLVLVGAVLAGVWNVARLAAYHRAAAAAPEATPVPGPAPEPPAHRLLRVGFGLLWILDGLLQLQPGMPVGLPTSVVGPSAATSPDWVRHVVHAGLTVWGDHPVQLAAAAVWVQLGLGLWLLAAPRGRWSRLGGLASVGWALVVWIFGEAFGGLFAPGLTWLFGAPGAVLLYAAAGGLLALDERRWRGPRLGRILLAVLGAFYLVMAVVQALPGRGFWQGRGVPGHGPGTLVTMVRQMAATDQPGLFSGWVRAFAGFDAAHGWAVNLFVVSALAAVGLLLCSGRRRAVLVGASGAALLGLADWVLVQDLGFFGGVGTDPNSMVPLLLLVATGVVGLLRAPAPVPAAVAQPAAPAMDSPRTPRTLARLALTAGAVAVVLVGTVPMALAATDRTADPVVSEALNGAPTTLDTPAPPFALVDQDGTAVTLSSLRGRTVALTFLDPVCTSDCPVIAQEFRQAARMLGHSAGPVALVAVVANPIYRSLRFTRAFDRQEGMSRVADWHFLTGSVSALHRVWAAYGAPALVVPAGAMVDHAEQVVIIDRQGNERAAFGADPGPDAASAASLATVVVQQVRQAAAS
jgi:cytochrome oxidase Cu insertion factor (SCO1/SenC/PrrC family)